ncbi:hypothetical protein GCM10010324_42970 [Streptomyces hiroshimensis]|uniref:Uncharacterized protein n=1 Tax=Streptomyces hiroshimensis TaxID=66424 RepID=A0ABQ2YTS2_9ACTN|nr:hypothetical protein GCM10010324_42970 [Streptomyces hiroshimensis]
MAVPMAVSMAMAMTGAMTGVGAMAGAGDGAMAMTVAVGWGMLVRGGHAPHHRKPPWPFGRERR